jgi:hypothetical protein
MSFENHFNITSSETKHGEPRVSLHERRAAKREACSQGEDQGENLGLSQAKSSVPQELPLGSTPLWAVLSARLLGSSLDHQLADGQAPETSRLLATRAQLLALPTRRRELAESWLSLLVEAREPVAPFNSRVPLARKRIIAAQSQIEALVDALLAPLATSRGIAMANSLLSDGAGPVYNRDCSVDLASTLREVLARLDPLGV